MSRYFRHSLGRLRSAVSKRNIFSDAQQIFIGGGLEKFQGGIKEEKYFLSQNNELILKMREQGAKLKCEKSHQRESELSEATEKKSSDYLALKETCSPNKHKNFQEEAFFLHEQTECTKRILHQMENEDRENTKQQTEENEKEAKSG
ncbi:uncharacterized protein LOC119640285 [Glossina fuscipes]|uniref:Uncharacterized protein LOC119640285 n=1 Tax=Glossina fuscipes TaxID=7396 RepID=A0A9C5Z6V2_9MUSC|nr:uncharacterized protein LOC119640285 [Glossina fuscipes]